MGVTGLGVTVVRVWDISSCTKMCPRRGALANLCFEVREWGHPTRRTRDAVLDAVRGLGVPALTDSSERIVPLRHDGRRMGLPPFASGRECINNTYHAGAVETVVKEFEDCPR